MMNWIKEHILLVLILVALGGPLAVVGGVKFADTPFFCGFVCHNMQPHVETLYENWHYESGVVCMDCHARPGFFNHLMTHIVDGIAFTPPYITGSYAKVPHGLHLHENVPAAREAIERSIEQAGGDPEASEWNFRPIEDDPAAVKRRYKKLCEGGDCHLNRLPLSLYLAVPEKKRELFSTLCGYCHERITNLAEYDIDKAKSKLGTPLEWREEEPSNLPNLHPLHLGREIHCIKCHSRVIHSEPAGIKKPAMNRCFRCHDDALAPRDCKKCHVGQTKMFAGTGARDVDEEESAMIDAIDPTCDEYCHKLDARKIYQINTESCVDCHDEDMPGQIGEYQKEFDGKLKQVAKLLEKAEKVIDSGGYVKRKAYADGRYNYLYAKNDTSRGIHNPYYATAVLDKAIEQLESAMTGSGSGSSGGSGH